MGLCRLVPTRYAFNFSAPLTDRNRELLKLKNIWRSTQGLQPLREPTGRQIAIVSDETILPLLEQLLRSRGSERAETRQRIEQLGLGTLPALHRRLNQMGQDDPSRVLLDLVIRRLACTVVDLTPGSDSLPLGDPVKARLRAMKGKPLDPAAFVQLVRGLLKEFPAEVYGMRFAVERAGNDTGIVVSFDLLNADRAARLARAHSLADWKTNEPSWEVVEMVKAGTGEAYTMGHSIANSSGAARAVVFGRFDFARFEKALAAACAGASDQPVEAIIQVSAK
jgi:hypothetical protein